MKIKKNQFIPKCAEKYKGRYPITWRSTWERSFMQWLDLNPGVVEWSSESVIIYYWDPVRGRKRRYYPDFMAKILNKDDEIVKYIIEVKPKHETKPPINTGKKSTKTLQYQKITYATNQAKWKSAEIYCKKMGMYFKVLTELSLFKR